jgi:hypothetical protein
MPGLKTNTWASGGDYTWLRNTDGLDEAVSGVLDVSTFTRATHYPNGYFPSGLPVRIDDLDVIRPWADAAGAVLGFLKGDWRTDQPAGVDAVEDINVSVITRGNPITAKVNAIVTFAVPTTAVQPRFFFNV